MCQILKPRQCTFSVHQLAHPLASGIQFAYVCSKLLPDVKIDICSYLEIYFCYSSAIYAVEIFVFA